MKIHENHPPRSILIVKLSAIGDVVQTLPMLEALKATFPEASIDWVVEEESRDLLEGHFALRRVILCPRKLWWKRLREGRNRWSVIQEVGTFIRDLRKTEYDWVIDTQGLLKSGIIVGLCRGRRKIGFQATEGIADEGNYLFTRERYPPLSIERHAVERYVNLMAQLGIPTGVPRLRFPVDERIQRGVREMLRRCGWNHEPLVVIHPMAKWKTKNWPPEHFTRLAQNLAEAGIWLVFTGSEEDGPAVQGMLSPIPHSKGIENWTGKTTLKELAALFSLADLVFSTDTGPMHLAAATQTPVIALFGPTAPWRTGPYGDGHSIIRRNLPCSPCFQKACATMECMKTITVDEVQRAIEKKLNSKGPRLEKWKEKSELRNFF